MYSYYVMPFAKRLSADSHDFRFRKLHPLLVQNLSNCQFHEIFYSNFWGDSCSLNQPCATAAQLAGIGVVPLPVLAPRAAPTCEYTKHKTFFEASEYIAAAAAATYSYTRTAAFSSWERSLTLTARTTRPRGRSTALCDVLTTVVWGKGTFMSEDTKVIVITPNRQTFFPEIENLNFGDWKLLRNWGCKFESLEVKGLWLIFKLQIFNFRKEKCSSIWSYDKNICTCGQKRTFDKIHLDSYQCNAAIFCAISVQSLI